MVRPLGNAEMALLGLLAREPMHPYRIEQEIRRRDLRSWTELSMSAVYKHLASLEKKGIVRVTKQRSPENRLRKIYALSEAGKKALKKGLLALLHAPVHTRWPVDIAISNSGLFTAEEVREALHNYKRALREKVAAYRERQYELGKAGAPPEQQALAVRPVYLLEAEIAWVNSFLNQLNR